MISELGVGDGIAWVVVAAAVGGAVVWLLSRIEALVLAAEKGSGAEESS